MKVNKKHLLIIILFLIISSVYVALNSFYLVSGADFDFHLFRVIGLAQSINNGDWFPKINYFMANGLGYGVPMFYGQYYLYIPAILITVFNFSVYQSWLILYVIFYSVSLTIVFFTGKKIGLSDVKSMIFAWLILFNPLIASIINGDMSFAICLVLTPLLLVYLDELLKNKKSSIIPIAIIATIIVNTHILSTIIIALICILYVISNYKKVTLTFFMKLGKALLVTLLLSAFFILPLIEQLLSQKLVATNTHDAFRYSSVYGLGEILVNSLNDSIKSISNFPTLSLVGIILLVAIILSRWKNNRMFSESSLLFVIISLIILGSNVFPWLFFSTTPLGSVQFVGRYLVFSLVLIIFQAVSEKKIPLQLFIVCLVVTFLGGLSKSTFPNMEGVEDKAQFATEYHNGLYAQKKLQRITKINDTKNGISGKSVVNGVSGGEYLNLNSNIEHIKQDDISTENVEIIKFERNYNEMTIDYKTFKGDDGLIVLPALWYKGFIGTYSNGGEGTQPALKEIGSDGEVGYNGLVSLEVKGQGRVTVKYKGTLVQKISFLISVCSIIFIFSYGLMKSKKLMKK